MSQFHHVLMARAAGEDITDAIALYNPNGPMAMIAFIVYLIVAIGFWYRTSPLHLPLTSGHFKLPKPRARYMRPVRYGATFMALGYLCRYTRRNGINAWSWLFETFFILLSPCAFLAQVYILLPIIATYLNAEDKLPLGGRAIKWIFILADVTTVLAQLAGTALTITFGDLVKIGKWVVTGGLWVQLVFFLSFMVIFIVFVRRVRRSGGEAMKGNMGGGKWNERWMSLIYIMFFACLCMLVRSIYRVAEYTAGAKSELGKSEPAFYILDALMMLLLMLSFHLVWPPACLDSDPFANAHGMTNTNFRPETDPYATPCAKPNYRR